MGGPLSDFIRIPVSDIIAFFISAYFSMHYGTDVRFLSALFVPFMKTFWNCRAGFGPLLAAAAAALHLCEIIYKYCFFLDASHHVALVSVTCRHSLG
jgi:hypothetical protein